VRSGTACETGERFGPILAQMTVGQQGHGSCIAGTLFVLNEEIYWWCKRSV